jgi:hypothetical protein
VVAALLAHVFTHEDQRSICALQKKAEARGSSFGPIVSAACSLLAKHAPIKLQVKVQGHFTDSVKNSMVHFIINSTTRLDKLFEAYCVKQNLDMQEVNFYYNGGRVMQDDTAQKLKMEEDDVIQAIPAESVLKDYQERVLMQRPPSAYFIFSDEKLKEVRVVSVACQAHARSLTCAVGELARRAPAFARLAFCALQKQWLP